MLKYEYLSMYLAGLVLHYECRKDVSTGSYRKLYVSLNSNYRQYTFS